MSAEIIKLISDNEDLKVREDTDYRININDGILEYWDVKKKKWVKSSFKPDAKKEERRNAYVNIVNTLNEAYGEDYGVDITTEVETY